MKTYRAGIDVGSTTVKLVILDDSGNVIFGDYRRHHSVYSLLGTGWTADFHRRIYLVSYGS